MILLCMSIYLRTIYNKCINWQPEEPVLYLRADLRTRDATLVLSVHQRTDSHPKLLLPVPLQIATFLMGLEMLQHSPA